MTEAKHARARLRAWLGLSAMVATSAGAIPVLPAGEVSPVGTTVSARPELAGLVLADTIRPFDIAVPGGGRLRGHLQDGVLRSTDTGTLVFTQRLVIDEAPAPAASLSEWRRSGMTAVTTDVDVALDGLGSVGAGSVQRLPSGSELRFKLARPVAPGESSRFHLALTNATHFAEGGRTVLTGPGVPPVVLPSYRPAGTPQPYYTATPLGYVSTLHAYLNDHGQVSATVGERDGATKAVLWQPRQANDIEGSAHAVPKLPGFPFNEGMRINNRGWIAGTSYHRADRRGDGRSRAFLWRPTVDNGTDTLSLEDLGTFPGGTYSVAWAVNDAGQVTGGGDYPGAPAPGADGLPYATTLLWSGGGVHRITASAFGHGFAINNPGVVAAVGSGVRGTYQGLVWTPSAPHGSTGTVTPVHAVGGPDYEGPGVASDINDHDVAVGGALFHYPHAPESHGFVWEPGRLIDLGLLEGPHSINDAGVAVGSWSGGIARLYRHGVRTTLRHFVSPARHWQLSWASDVNAIEQITGLGWSPDTGHALLLMTPVRITEAAPSPRGRKDAYVMSIEGTGFLDGATVLFNGAPLATTRLHSKRLEATVPSSLLGAGGEIAVLVVNPDGTSSTVRSF